MIKKILLASLCLTTLSLSDEIFQNGKASFYTTKIGTITASGERLKDTAYTAAHKNLPFGTIVRVTCKKTKKSVDVKITDRGPFIKGRVIDVTLAAAKELDMVEKGVIDVELTIIGKDEIRR